MIFFLAKVFEQQKYADAFLRGEIFVNRLSYFKKIEEGDGRGDKYEGAIMLPIEGLTITLRAPDTITGEVDEKTMTKDDLVAPPIIEARWNDHINVFCMYAGHSGTFRSISEDNIRDLKKQVELPEECTNLGEHAVVITNTKEFLRRAKAAADREGYRMTWKLVTYYDSNVGTPLARSEIESIFTKRDQYAYQKEFRIAIDTCTSGTHAITLNIGPIGDIALRLRTGDINRGLSLNLPPYTPTASKSPSTTTAWWPMPG